MGSCINNIKYALVLLPSAIVSLAAMESSVIDLDSNKSTRKYGLIKDSSEHHKSLDVLQTMRVNHFDENHANIKSLISAGPLPSSVDLSGGFPAPFDQGQLGSCTAFSIIGLVMYDLKKQTGKDFDMMSALYLYWQERNYENKIDQDTGASIADGIRTLVEKGICRESTWPYQIEKFKDKPSDVCDTEATLCKDQDQLYMMTASVSLEENTIKALLNNGSPIVLGIDIYKEFESYAVANSGMVSMPTPGEQLFGRHAVDVVGYDDATSTWLMRNSWGNNWGLPNKKGYFKLPYAYLTSGYAYNAWTIGSMSVPNYANPVNPNANTSCCCAIM